MTNKFITTTTLWWTTVIILMTVTLLIHLTGYQFGFPYAEEFDEARIMWNAYAMRIGNSDWVNLQGYPPGIFWVHYIVQPLVESQTGRPSELDGGLILSILRILSIIVNSLTVLFIALTGRKLTYPVGGLLAALAWAVMPAIAFETRLALTESWQVMFYTLALLLSIISLHNKSYRAAIFSVLFGLCAVIFKYAAFPALGFGVGVVLWQIYTQSTDRRAWLCTLTIQVILIITCAVYLFMVADAGALGDSPEITAFASNDLTTLFNIPLLQTITARSFTMLGLSSVAGLLILIAGTTFIVIQGQTWQRLIWLFMLIVYISTIMLVSLYMVFIDGLARYLTPVTPILALMLSLSIVMITTWRSEKSKSRFLVFRYVIPVLIALLWLPPSTNELLNMVNGQARPATTGTLSAWTLNFLTEDDRVLFDTDIRYSRQGVRMFDRAMGTYQGDWVPFMTAEITSQSLDYWRTAENLNYYMANDLTLNNAENADAYLNNMLLMKQLPPPGEEGTWHGQPLYFYRLWNYEQKTDVAFGASIRLRGYDLNLTQVQPGDTLQFIPYWSANTMPGAQYNLYMHLYPTDSRDVIAQADGTPAGEKRPTMTWDDTHEIIIGEPRNITLPDDSIPGDYRLAIGLYDWQTGTRLLTDENQDFTVIDIITIQASE